MELDINNDRIILSPDPSTIAQELVGLEDYQFAILRNDDHAFIQTLVDPDTGLVLEYKEGKDQLHFGTASPPKTIQEVIAAFTSYLNGTDQWKDDFEWSLLEFEEADFTVVVSIAPKAIDLIDNPFDCEERVELPDLGIDNLIALYGLLTGTFSEALTSEFTIIAEVEPEGLEEVTIVDVPINFQELLSQLTDEDFSGLAQQWHYSADFPQDEFDVAETTALVARLSRLAAEAAGAGNILVACSLG